MASRHSRAMKGALKVIRECLYLDRRTPVVIFCDETTADAAEVLHSAAKQLEVPSELHFEPLERQRQFTLQGGLPTHIARLLDRCHGVITCFAADPGSTPFRLELLRQATQRDKRVGHMPGVNLFVLAYAVNIDYARVRRLCDDLSLALTMGERARLETHALRGDRVETLEIELGGMNRSAVLSTGIIPPGTWGNLPGGETFIAPIEGTAHGRFLLNGAFNGHVLRRGTSLTLDFENGRLTDVMGPKRTAARFWNLFTARNGDPRETWRTLAELGVGVNEGIRRLTGNSLFDEKCLGTIHIALGDNSTFGGKSESDYHEDLVTIGPSLHVDGKPVLDRGEFVFDGTQWREDIDTFPVDPALQPPNLSLMRDLINARDENGTLLVEIRISDGRINRYTLGDSATSRILAGIYSEIPQGRFRIELATLQRAVHRKLALNRLMVLRGLSILKRHRLVAIA